MDFSRHTELLEGIVNQLIDEEGLGVCLEMHRAIKLGYYELLYPEDSVYEKQPIVDVKGLDIFGNTPLSIKKNIDCMCPNCSRTLGAQKFAPHLEKCMGMGRNSSRLAATKKPKTTLDSEQEGSEDNEDEWTYPEARNKGLSKKLKKEKGMSSSPLRTGRGPGRPPKHQHKDVQGQPQHSSSEGNTAKQDFLSVKPSQMMHTIHSFKQLPMEHKISLLDQICGVVSERTGRLCTRSVNCPQHLEDQRRELRSILLADRRRARVQDVSPPPAKKSKSARRSSPEVLDDLDMEGSPLPSSALPHTKPHLHSKGHTHLPSQGSRGHAPSHHAHSDNSSAHVRKKKNKSSKKGKRSHDGITMATTVLHSSPMY